MKEVELNELDPEKQPMTGDGQTAAGEKNGSVQLRVPEDEVTFTGLSKDELMRVAGTPGWVRTRWVLLVLFWLGWVGMLAGAIVIIVQAPRCKPIPDMSWWNEGPLYQISDVKAFSGGLEGVAAKLDEINQLKVKGLVLGPFHTVQKDQPATLNAKQMDPLQGQTEDLTAVLEKAHKKGISVVLDLTPNYLGEAPWFSSTNVDSEVMEQVQAGAEHWLGFGVDGIKIPDLPLAANSAEWSKLQAAVKGNHTADAKKKVLMGVVNNITAADVSRLANTTGVDLVLSDLLNKNGGKQRIQAMDVLGSQQRSVGWGLGAAEKIHLSKSTDNIRLYHLLLLTMPGTPVFSYGDEIGLNAQGAESPAMVWDEEKAPEGAAVNKTAKAEQDERAAVKKWFKSISELRVKERSLLHGDYYSLYSSDSSLAFLRLWDQSERYITAVNWGSTPEKLTFTLTAQEEVKLPDSVNVKLSTDENLKADSSVSLKDFTLGPRQAVLLQFPYTG